MVSKEWQRLERYRNEWTRCLTSELDRESVLSETATLICSDKTSCGMRKKPSSHASPCRAPSSSEHVDTRYHLSTSVLGQWCEVPRGALRRLRTCRRILWSVRRIVEGEASGLLERGLAAGEGHASRGTYRKWGLDGCRALAKDKTAMLTLIFLCSRGLQKEAF